MSVFYKTTKVKDLYYKNTKIKEIYYGNIKVYSSSKPWVQPVLTSNGSMGGNSFACKASGEINITGVPYYAYGAFAGSKFNVNGVLLDGEWGTSGSSGSKIWLSWYNPVPLNIKKLMFKYAAGSTDSFVLQYSNNGSSWTGIASGNLSAENVNNLSWRTIDLSNSTISSKYWRIYITVGDNAMRLMSNLTVTALV